MMIRSGIPRRSIGRDVAAWVRSIRARYGLTTCRRVLPARRFLRQPRPLLGERVVERLRTLVLRLTPRIELRFARGPRPTGFRPPPLPPPTVAAMRPAAAVAPVRTVASAPPAPASSLTTPRPLPRAERSSPGAVADGGRPAVGTAVRDVADGPIRVADRIEGGRPVRTVSRRRVERQERRIETLAVRRLAHRRTRVEERAMVRAARVVKSSLETPRPGGHSRGPELEPHSATASRSSSRPAAAAPGRAAPPAPAIDVRSLTEQVARRLDRRVLAWRERTGRI